MATVNPPPEAGQSPPPLSVHLTSGRTLARNTVWNLFGQGAAVLVAVLTVPILIQKLGTDRFGVLLLIWMLVGYASLFDLGVGRALTKMVADKIGEDRLDQIPPLFSMSMLIMLVLGIFAALLLAVWAPWLVASVLRVPADLYQETLYSFYLVAICLPIVITTSGLAGVLEAWQRFDLIAAVTIPLSILQYAGPLLVLPFTTSLTAVMAVILASRLAAWGVRLAMCYHVMPTLRTRFTWRPEFIRPLISFGGWLTVTNIVSPLMVTLDRFFISAITSISQIAFYATPNEILSRLLNIPAALSGVLFPAFALTFTQDRARSAQLFDRTARYIFVCMFPAVLLSVAFAPEWLAIWLGADFAKNAAVVAQWMGYGILLNSLGRLAFTFVQGVGRAKWTGLLHLAELPLYLGVLYLLTTRFGIAGAAVASTLRFLVDTVSLLIMVRILLPPLAPNLRQLWWMLGGAGVVLMTFMLPLPFAVRAVWALTALAGGMLISWLFILTTEERSSLFGTAGRLIRLRHAA